MLGKGCALDLVHFTGGKLRSRAILETWYEVLYPTVRLYILVTFITLRSSSTSAWHHWQRHASKHLFINLAMRQRLTWLYIYILIIYKAYKSIFSKHIFVTSHNLTYKTQSWATLAETCNCQGWFARLSCPTQPGEQGVSLGPSFVLLEIIYAICVSAWHHYHAIAVHHYSISYLPQEDVVSMSKLARDAATLWARIGSGWDGTVEVRHLPGSASCAALIQERKAGAPLHVLALKSPDPLHIYPFHIYPYFIFISTEGMEVSIYG